MNAWCVRELEGTKRQC